MRTILLTLCVVFGLGSTFAQSELPNLTLKHISGTEVNLEELGNSDELTVITLWATWCVPCIRELEAINDFYTDWQDELGITLYAVSQDDTRTSKRVRPMVAGKGWEYEVLLDPNNDLQRHLGAANIPVTIVVQNGEIVYRRNNYAPGAEHELYEKLVKLKG